MSIYTCFGCGRETKGHVMCDDCIKAAKFRKSSYCGNSGCVEVLIGPFEVTVRNTKDKTWGAWQVYTYDEWAAFIAGAKNGEFDLPERAT